MHSISEPERCFYLCIFFFPFNICHSVENRLSQSVYHNIAKRRYTGSVYSWSPTSLALAFNSGTGALVFFSCFVSFFLRSSYPRTFRHVESLTFQKPVAWGCIICCFANATAVVSAVAMFFSDVWLSLSEFLRSNLFVRRCCFNSNDRSLFLFFFLLV